MSERKKMDELHRIDGEKGSRSHFSLKRSPSMQHTHDKSSRKYDKKNYFNLKCGYHEYYKLALLWVDKNKQSEKEK